MKRHFFTLALIFCVATKCGANEAFSYPGGIAQLEIAKGSADIPDVKFGLNEPVIMEYQNHWRILIGLSLDTLPGEYVAYIKSGAKDATGQYQKVIVKQHIYPFKEYSELDKNTAKQAVLRTHKSYSKLDYSNTQQPTLPLNWPMKGDWSNNFGHKLFDKTRNSLHTPNAVVLSTTEIATVTAPQTAIVSNIETNESGISTVFLDHGRGLYSILSGLSDLTVELGNGIVAGAVIGKLPSSSNVTTENLSPSANTLIWQTVINNTYVDPVVLTKLKP